MYEIADIYNEVTRKARKDHYCVSGAKIKKGDQYITVSSLYDGHWSSFKMHMRFRDWLNEINEGVEFYSQATPDDYLDGDLTYKQLCYLRNILMDTGGQYASILTVTMQMNRIIHGRQLDELYKENAELKKQIERLHEALKESQMREAVALERFSEINSMINASRKDSNE